MRAATLLLLLLAACSVTTPLIDPKPFAAHVDKQKTETAIKAACAERGWKLDAQTDGRINAAFAFEPVRVARVMIIWDPNEVRMSYLDSDGLNHASVTGTFATIDPRYNDAVAKLAQAIQLQIQRLK